MSDRVYQRGYGARSFAPSQLAGSTVSVSGRPREDQCKAGPNGGQSPVDALLVKGACSQAADESAVQVVQPMFVHYIVLANVLADASGLGQFVKEGGLPLVNARVKSWKRKNSRRRTRLVVAHSGWGKSDA